MVRSVTRWNARAAASRVAKTPTACLTRWRWSVAEVCAMRAAEGAADGDVPTLSIDELVANEDVQGLIELGAAHRIGAGAIERDAFKAVECFEAASRLGSAEAEYFVGVAFMNGLGVGRDVSTGATRLRSAAQRDRLHPGFLGRCRRVGVEGRQHHTRSDDVGADAVGGIVLRQCPVEGVEEGLGAGIDACPRPAAVVGGHRTGGDDVAVLLRHEMRQGGLAGHHHRAAVEVDHLAEQVVVDLLRRRPAHQPAGVVDEDVEPVQRIDRFVHQAGHRLAVGHVGTDGKGDAAGRGDLLHHLVGGGTAGVVVHGNAGAAFGEPLGDGGTDAGGCTGHQHFLAGKIVQV